MVCCCICDLHKLENLGLDKTLFLLDPTKLNISGLSVFYRNLFKVWSLLVFKQTEDPQSLYWLLEEPLVRGARLDLSANGLFPGLNKALVDNKVVTLGQLLETAGLDLKMMKLLLNGWASDLLVWLHSYC